jgi:hypothetical protein
MYVVSLLCVHTENIRSITLEISLSGKSVLHKYLSKHDRFIKNKLKTTAQEKRENQNRSNLLRSDLCCRSRDIELEIQPLVPIY